MIFEDIFPQTQPISQDYGNAFPQPLLEEYNFTAFDRNAHALCSDQLKFDRCFLNNKIKDTRFTLVLY